MAKIYNAEKLILKMPPVTLKNIIDHVKLSLNITHVKGIGDMEQVCETIALLPGAAGGQRQMLFVEKENRMYLLLAKCMNGNC
jgi:hypothetical protein